MATSSTEAVPSSNQPYRGLVHNNLSSAREKIWNGDIVATASTHGFWEPDSEFKIKVKVNKLKRKFHQNRYLQIKHLPRDVSEEEIHQMLSDFPISSVSLSCGHGSAGSAKAYLEDPEMLEEWDKDRTFLLRGQKIPVSPALTELVLCVARCPSNYSESQFSGLVRSFGEIKMCFMMISEKTGENKGYGFVEYVSKELAVYAKGKLDGMIINDVTLCADFIDSTHITFESLHSKCLYVDNLPDNYRDMGEFRRKFSKVVNPPYCQIALKNGCPQNWGLVEFNTGEDAESTRSQLNGCELKDKKLRISYYIPGVRAINLYLKLLNDNDNNRGKGNGLLPTPPPSVMESFKNLQKQNPIFAQSIQNIVVTERQLGVGNNGVGPAANGPSCDDGKSSYKNGVVAPRKKCRPNSKPSLSCSPASDIPPSSEVPIDQAALYRFLSGQAPTPGIPQSPQIASFLKQYKGVLNGAGTTAGHHLIPQSLAPPDPAGLPIPTAVPGIVPAIPVIPTLPGLSSSDYASRGVFLDPVKAAAAAAAAAAATPVNVIGVNPPVDQGSTPSYNGKSTDKTAGIAGQSNIWNSNVNSNSGLPLREGEQTDKASLTAEDSVLISQGHHLPFSGPQINAFPQRPGLGYAALMPGAHPLTRSIPPVPGLQPVITEPPQRTLPQNRPNGFHSNWFPQGAVIDSTQFQIPASVISPASPDNGLALISQNAILPILVENPNPNLVNESLGLGSLISKQNPNLYKFAQANVLNDSSVQQVKNFPFNGNDDSGKKKNQYAGSNVNGNQYRGGSGSAGQQLSDSQSSLDSEAHDADSPIKSRLAQAAAVQPHLPPLPLPVWSPESAGPAMPALPTTAGSASPSGPPRPIGFEARWRYSSKLRPAAPPVLAYSHSGWTSETFVPPLGSAATPVGQKRKSSRFLPSPERSPENDYIGQHLQGIGGHYMDSWPKRKKKN